MSGVNPTREDLENRSVFPAPIYLKTVLKQVFDDAKQYLFKPLVEIEYAHTLMLARQQILPVNEAAICLRALDSLDHNEVLNAEYDGSFEDLFFLLEKVLASACGAEIAGKMHTARSRNDIDLTMYRMIVRERLAHIFGALLDLRRELVGLAWEHRLALMPAYTHNQPAQPTTLGHYLMAFVEILERDAERITAAYSRVNRCPLGACAITTTGFPIDRHYTERLLGFEGLQVNSYGAIASVDYLAESCSVLATSMLSLGRLAQDLLLWSTAEFNYLRLSDGYVQISSIMPQKRNPVPLEHVRILASRALTQGQSALVCLHNTPFADMNDAEDGLQPLVYKAFEDGERSVRLLTGALNEAEFNTLRMAAAADENFLPVTELADTLVRTAGMSFRAAHSIVSLAVRELNGNYAPEAITDIVERELAAVPSAPAVPRKQIREALSAQHFVAVRRVPGGPASEVLEPEVLRARGQITLDERWLHDTEQKWASARASIREQNDALLRRADGR
jgi:argininosuccinate lyase